MLPPIHYTNSPIPVVKTPQEFARIPAVQTSAIDYLKTAQQTEDVRYVVFVRHAVSIANEEGSIAGRTEKFDCDLSDKGKKQAQELGENLGKSRSLFQVVYSSPSLRALNTVKAILSQNPLTEPHLFEKWYGKYEGADKETYAPIKKIEEKGISRLPTFYDKFHFCANAQDPKQDRIETMQQVFDRTATFMQTLPVKKKPLSAHIMVS